MTAELVETVPGPAEPAERPRWSAVLLVCSLRLGLLVAAQVALYAGFTLGGTDEAWGAALSYANVYVTIPVDLVTFGVLVRLMRREGGSVGDLIGFRRDRIGRDVLIGFGVFVALVVVFVVGSIVGALVAYGPDVASNPPGLPAGYAPPLWVLVWALAVLPLSVGFAEELAYRGYLQPRIARLTGAAWLGVLLPSMAFGLQHLALPLVDVQTSVSRVIPAFLAGLLLAACYARLKRIMPLVYAHWLLNFLGLGLFPLLAAVSG